MCLPTDDYIHLIDMVIKKLESFNNINVEILSTAATLIAHYNDTMTVIKQTVAGRCDTFCTSMFATKIIARYDPPS